MLRVVSTAAALRILPVVAGLIAMLAAQPCAADELTLLSIGGASIAIPAPAGFKNVASNPEARWLTEPYRSAAYDVAALYVPADVRIETVQAGREVRRHMVLLRPLTAELQQRKTASEFRGDAEPRRRLAEQYQLRVVRDEGNVAATLAIRSSPPLEVAVETVSLLLRERVVTLHVVSVHLGDEDQRWVTETADRWIESIEAKNR
jgi:hypothetical protein